jgi:hypothetical protein
MSSSWPWQQPSIAICACVGVVHSLRRDGGPRTFIMRFGLVLVLVLGLDLRVVILELRQAACALRTTRDHTTPLMLYSDCNVTTSSTLDKERNNNNQGKERTRRTD